MTLLDGKQTSSFIQYELAAQVAEMKQHGLRVPHLCAILVGNDGASETYVHAKVKACDRCGFTSSIFRFPDNVSEEKLLEKIQDINLNPHIDGLIVQLPLPGHINPQKITEAITPAKDVDGFHPQNTGRMALGLPAYISATPLGILELLKHYHIETSGKNCTVIGRSHIVGSPMSILMARNAYPGNCTVTLCHSKTKNIQQFTRHADIIIVALGKPGFLKKEMIQEGAVVIDVGITRIEAQTKSGFRLAGDVDFDNVAPLCSFITPVPGGVGPMTIAALLQNTMKAARKEIYP